MIPHANPSEIEYVRGIPTVIKKAGTAISNLVQ